MGNYEGAGNWSPAFMDDDSTMYGSRKRTRSSINSDEEGSVLGSVIGSVVSGLASNTVLQPNFIGGENIITALHSPKQFQSPIIEHFSPNSPSQSEFEYLQSVFPHINKKEDIAALYENTQSDISTNTTSTQHYLNENLKNHPKLITGMPPQPQRQHDMYAPINSLNHMNNNNNYQQTNRKIISSDNNNTAHQEEHKQLSIDSNNNVIIDNYIDGDKHKKKKRKKRKKKRKKKQESEYQALGTPHSVSQSQYSSYDNIVIKHEEEAYDHDDDRYGCCEFMNTLFYMIIAILSVCLIFGSLFVDVCMAIYVYWPHETAPLGRHVQNIYFIPCIIAIGLTLISYFLNSCCFFIHTDYCGCAGKYIAPLLRCFISLPPFGVIYTLMLIPGVHSLPFHMASALCQYLLNLMYMMTNTQDVIIWNWVQLGVGSGHLILSPMFAWLQQSNQGNLTVVRCLKLMILWLCSISPLTILELINIFPVFIEYFSNDKHELDIRTFITLICWSILIRLIFAFIFVDEDGSRLSLICFKPLRVYAENAEKDKNKKGKKKKKIKKHKKPMCYMCIYFFRAIGQLILQLFYLALPLLPTAAATVRLYKKQCIEYAKWNHLCISVYLIFTYLPMLYLLLGNNNPAAYTWITISTAYGCTIWVVLFLPIYLKKWVNFRW